MRAARFAALFSLVAVLYFGGIVRAQEPAWTGSIEGTVRVKEASNAAVEVTAIEADTGRPYFTKTDERGRFRFTGLPAGEFQVFAATEGFYPVWETGTVDVETPWRPELLLKTRIIRGGQPLQRLELIFLALERFRSASSIYFGVIESAEKLPKPEDDGSADTFRVTVIVREVLKGKQTSDWVSVEQKFGILQASSIVPEQEVLVFVPASENVSGNRRGYFFLYPEIDGREIFLQPLLWELFEMARTNHVSRPELIEWLTRGIENKGTRGTAAAEARSILRRKEENSSTRKSRSEDSFDLADPEQPLFSEGQIKRIADVVFQDDEMVETDIGVVRLLIGLKYPPTEKLLLNRIEKRKTDWTEPTATLLQLHSSLREEEESKRLAKLFEEVQTAAAVRISLETPEKMTPHEQSSKARLLAGPPLSLILKSYFWTLEHPAKDVK